MSSRSNGADPAGNLVCPSCALPREVGHYLCLACWRALPARAQASLKRRDRLARSRLRELLDQLHDGTPLDRIEVAP
ncbi:hypothetical protein ACIQPR_18290 [Streptomyces sp. NPDC091280]|uniref:hypothetical protein n=1 Tax=Streptomyces sp. NPDC091280 TaxID=3365984 RepID=UPI0037F3A735